MKRVFEINVALFKEFPENISERPEKGTNHRFCKEYLTETVEEARQRAILDFFEQYESEEDLCLCLLERYIKNGQRSWRGIGGDVSIAFRFDDGKYKDHILMVDSARSDLDVRE